MNEGNVSPIQPLDEPPKSLGPVWMTIFATMVVAALSGGGVYWRLSSDKAKLQEQCNNEINKLKLSLETNKNQEIANQKESSKEEFLHIPDIIFETKHDDTDPKNSSTAIIIKDYDKKIGEINTPGHYYPAIYKQTAKNVYVSLLPDGMGGYIPYFGPSELYKLNLEDYSLTTILNYGYGDDGKERTLFLEAQDISVDEKKMAFTGERKNENGQFEKIVGVMNIDDQTIIKEFKVPNGREYGIVGDVFFSPNNKKISLAAAVGDPEKEKGSVFIIDLISGEIKSIESGDRGFYRIEGWSNGNDLLESFFVPQRGMGL